MHLPEPRRAGKPVLLTQPSVLRDWAKSHMQMFITFILVPTYIHQILPPERLTGPLHHVQSRLVALVLALMGGILLIALALQLTLLRPRFDDKDQELTQADALAADSVEA